MTFGAWGTPSAGKQVLRQDNSVSTKSDEAARSMLTALISQLRSVVGDSHLLDEPSVMEAYCVDWTGRFVGPALCVVRPGSTDEVADVMRACVAAGVPVLPQGGRLVVAEALGNVLGIDGFGFGTAPQFSAQQRLRHPGHGAVQRARPGRGRA